MDHHGPGDSAENIDDALGYRVGDTMNVGGRELNDPPTPLTFVSNLLADVLRSIVAVQYAREMTSGAGTNLENESWQRVRHMRSVAYII